MTDTSQVPGGGGGDALPASRQVLRSLRAVVLAMQMYADGVGHDLGLHRSDLMAMNLMSQAAAGGRSMTPSEVAKSMSLSAAAVTALVDRLERVGHLARHPDPADRRRVRLDVSQQAEEIGRSMFRPMNDALAEVMEQYTEADLQMVVGMLEQFTAAVQRASEGDSAKVQRGGGPVHPTPAPTLGDHATG